MWKLLTSAALLAGVAYTAHRRRVEAIERRCRRLETELDRAVGRLAETTGDLGPTSDDPSVRKLIEVERLRLRIAADLHDDVGSSLTQIAILSEVARRDLGDGPAAGRLDKIAEGARELAATVSDIVWSIDPERDRSQDLATRMRRFASDVLAAQGVRFRFDAAAAHQDLHLDGELRRQAYLIFKEAVNNVARHADCTAAAFVLAVDGGRLRLRIADNGRGFDLSKAGGGHGLASMRRRAALLGGQLEIASSPGAGTTVELSTPLRQGDAPARPSHHLPE